MKKFIGVLLTFAMLVSAMPVWAATGTNEENLLDKGGVAYSASGPGLHGTELLDVFDGIASTRTYVNDSNGAYIQAELPCAMQITKVTLTGRHDSKEGSYNLVVSLSNDAAFEKSVPINGTNNLADGIEEGASVEFNNTDTAPYKYIRVSHKNLVVLAEIDVYGYYVTPEHAAGPDGVQITDLSNLSSTAYASNPEPLYATTHLDGVKALDNSICYLQGKNMPIWFMMDFGVPCRVNQISVIGAKSSGDINVNQCMIEASNTADFSEYDILGFELNSKSYGFNDGPVFDVYTEKEYRYIRVRKKASASSAVSLIFDKITVNGYLNDDVLNDDVLSVTDINITDNATNVTDDIIISFNKAIDSTTIFDEHILGSSHNCFNGTLEFTFEATGYPDELYYNFYLSDDRQQIIIPINQFDSKREYTLNLYDASSIGCEYLSPIKSIFGDALQQGTKITFTTGDITVSEDIPDNAGLTNVLLNKIPSEASSNVTDLSNLSYLTSDTYEANKGITKAENVTTYVTYDLLAEHDIYSLSIAWTYGGYGFGTILVYGSNNNKDFELIATTTSKKAIDGVGVQSFVFEEPCKYRYIKFSAESANTTIRPCELAAYSAVTDTLASTSYNILACDIIKDDSGNVIASTGITNISDAEITSPVFIVALYDVADGTETLVATAAIPAQNLAAGTGTPLSATVSSTALAGKTYNKAKLFVLDDTTDTFKPVCKPLVVTDITN